MIERPMPHKTQGQRRAAWPAQLESSPLRQSRREIRYLEDFPVSIALEFEDAIDCLGSDSKADPKVNSVDLQPSRAQNLKSCRLENHKMQQTPDKAPL